MNAPEAIDPSQFIHVRMVLSMVVSLALARLLSGLARFVQHPGRTRVFGPHLLWSAFMLILLIHFWWWEFALIHLRDWHFASFAFVVGYAAVLYLVCAILYPDDMAEYGSFAAYFMSRRRWLFAILAAVMLVDLIDTRIKGEEHWRLHTPDIWLRTAAGLGLCALAAWARRPGMQVAIAAAGILGQLWWIARLYAVLR